jgi:hypothetical protein
MTRGYSSVAAAILKASMAALSYRRRIECQHELTRALPRFVAA